MTGENSLTHTFLPFLNEGDPMKKLPFKKIDAFATNMSDGNPAGYINLENNEALTTEEMLLIAKQLKGFVSEVGFATRLDKETINLKYYSSEKEVEFCGHATIAILYDIIKNDRDLPKKKNIYIKTNKGSLKVVNRIKEEDAVYIYSPKPNFKECSLKVQDLMEALLIKKTHLDNDYPISLVNAGLDTLMVPIYKLDNLLSINPDIDELKRYCMANHIDIIEVFTKDVYNKNDQYRTRVFAPIFGYLEDPATGSGNSAFGYYLRKIGKWESDSLKIEQNSNKENYNLVRLKIVKENDNEERVLFGGPAVVRIEGSYLLT